MVPPTSMCTGALNLVVGATRGMPTIGFLSIDEPSGWGLPGLMGSIFLWKIYIIMHYLTICRSFLGIHAITQYPDGIAQTFLNPIFMRPIWWLFELAQNIAFCRWRSANYEFRFITWDYWSQNPPSRFARESTFRLLIRKSAGPLRGYFKTTQNSATHLSKYNQSALM